MEQGTEEWKLARLGKVTASRVSDARAKDLRPLVPRLGSLG